MLYLVRMTADRPPLKSSPGNSKWRPYTCIGQLASAFHYFCDLGTFWTPTIVKQGGGGGVTVQVNIAQPITITYTSYLFQMSCKCLVNVYCNNIYNILYYLANSVTFVYIVVSDALNKICSNKQISSSTLVDYTIAMQRLFPLMQRPCLKPCWLEVFIMCVRHMIFFLNVTNIP